MRQLRRQGSNKHQILNNKLLAACANVLYRHPHSSMVAHHAPGPGNERKGRWPFPVSLGSRHPPEGVPTRRVRRSLLKRGALRVIAIAALASGPILAECHPAALPGPPFVLAQAYPAPAVPVTPAPAPEQPIGLPRVRNYEPIPELRDIYFDFGKTGLRPGDVKILEANAAWLRAHPGHLVLIEGHSDNRGTASRKNEVNIDLGERRAQAAMDFLISEGVHPSRITILSYGEERPLCTEESERCWSQNRRSRFLVKPR